MITASDFKLVGATEDDKVHLNQTLAYLQSDPNMAKVVRQAADLKVEIRFSNNSRDGFYDPAGPYIQWDSLNGLHVWDSKGNSGIMSPASVLGHEMAHATDPNFTRNNNQSAALFGYDDYDWMSEVYAIDKIETPFNRKMGEPVRDNHRGEFNTINSPNPLYSVSKTVDEYGNLKQQIESTGNFDPKTNILDRRQTQTIAINGQQVLEKEIHVSYDHNKQTITTQTIDYHPDKQGIRTFTETITDFNGDPIFKKEIIKEMVGKEEPFSFNKEKPGYLSRFMDRKVDSDQITEMPLSVSDSGNLPNVGGFSMMGANAKSALMAEKQSAPEQPKEVAREQEAESDASSKPNPKSDMDF